MKRVFEITGFLAVLTIAATASGQAAAPEADDERLARRNAIGKGTIHHNAHPDGILPADRLQRRPVVTLHADGRLGRRA